jgi:hypothetical protein
MTTRPTVVVRVSAVERCLIGTLLLARPDTVTALIAADEPQPPAWLVRVLGGRLLTQGLLEYARPHPFVVLAGAAVDSVHAASMIGAAMVWPAYRRTATASAAEATLSAVLGATLARRQS